MTKRVTFDQLHFSKQEEHVVNTGSLILFVTQDMAKQYAFDAADALLRSGLPMAGKARDVIRAVRDYERCQYQGLMGYSSGNYSDRSNAPLTALAALNDAFDEETAEAVARLEEYTRQQLDGRVLSHAEVIAKLYTAYNLAVAAGQVRDGLFRQVKAIGPRMVSVLRRIVDFDLRQITFRLSLLLDSLRHWHRDTQLGGEEFDRMVLDVFTPYVNMDNINRIVSGCNQD
jgi:hypothetical protein